MKSPIVSLVACAACWLLAACSPPKEEKKDSQSPPSVDPWKAASEWPIPASPIGDAQRFLLHASAFQITGDYVEENNLLSGHSETCVVWGNALSNEYVEQPRTTGLYTRGARNNEGVYTDGEREFVYINGKYEQGPAASALLTLTSSLRDFTLQYLLESSEERALFLRSDKVDGVEAEIYAFVALREHAKGRVSGWAAEGGHAWVWIAKDDHRPLKLERKTSGRESLGSGPYLTITATYTFHYDPNVKVTVPEH